MITERKQLRDLKLGDFLYSIGAKIENEELIYFIDETKVTRISFVYSKTDEEAIINDFLSHSIYSTHIVSNNFSKIKFYYTTKEEIVEKLEQMLKSYKKN